MKTSNKIEYLWDCLDNSRFSKKQELTSVENEIKKLGGKDKRLSLEMIKVILGEGQTKWEFREIWYFPGYEKIKEALGKLEGNITFVLSERKWKETAKRLLSIMNWIESVSVVLRFVKPESFGIISPPVEYVLWIQRKLQPMDTYEAYLNNLEEIKKESGLPRIADVDHALWVHFFRMQEKEPDAIKFEDNPVLNRIRLQNISDILFSKHDLSQIGKVLVDLAQAGNNEQIHRMAGLILGVHFERLVLKIAGKRGWKEDKKSESALYDAIEFLGDRINMKGELHACREIRNNFVHPQGVPTPRDLRTIKEVIQKLEGY